MNHRFLEILLESQVLTFGSFKTKAGRISPYFFNTGKISTGARIEEVATCFATEIDKNFANSYDGVFGPAYKGIPLAVATSIALVQRHKKDVFYAFNRKEEKTRGEGGILVGHEFCGTEKVVLIEDVISGGTSLREVVEILKSKNVEIAGMIVGIDRQELGYAGKLAKTEIESITQKKLVSLLTLDEIVTALHNRVVLGKVWIDDEIFESIEKYRKKYGGSAC